MSAALELSWLAGDQNWDQDLMELATQGAVDEWKEIVRLANRKIDFVQTGKLDRAVQRLSSRGISASAIQNSIKVAILGSSTIRHLIPGIRVAGLRRGLWVEVFEGGYGQYFQELTNSQSALFEFSPQVVCFAFDSTHLRSIANGDPSATVASLRSIWKLTKDSFRCSVIQQTGLPHFPDIVGNNEHRLRTSPQTFIAELNAALRSAAITDGVDLLAVDKYAALDGLRLWYDSTLWHSSKQEVHPRASHMYGEYLIRIIGAQLGRSKKCLVLDLDNTLWGGVIGDDGLNGIRLGQGSAIGEAFVGFQHYLLRLKDRGVVLAVCSKNDESNAILPFESHPDMQLRRDDIACFVCNWDDKVSNLRLIASHLNLGTDSFVFVDDNPFERNMVREHLPEVAVPEMPEDPAMYVQVLSSAGYFEATQVTDEDLHRAAQYRANAERETLKRSKIDITDYLKELRMELIAQPFDELNLNRIVQLINKTNQFNLTTKRYSETEIRTVISDSSALTWQIRLKDRFGDNGIISVIFGRLNSKKEFEIDTWLMSCRVLGRQVEDECLNLVASDARNFGAHRLIGRYHPTAKNMMVRDLYHRFGFNKLESGDIEDSTWTLDLNSYQIRDTFISTSKVVGHAG